MMSCAARGLRHAWGSGACRDPVCEEELPQHLRRQAWLHGMVCLWDHRAIVHGIGCPRSCWAVLRGRCQGRRDNGCPLKPWGGLKWGCQRALLLSCCKRGPPSLMALLLPPLKPLSSLATGELQARWSCSLQKEMGQHSKRLLLCTSNRKQPGSCTAYALAAQSTFRQTLPDKMQSQPGRGRKAPHIPSPSSPQCFNVVYL